MNKLNTVKLPLAAWLVSLSCGAVAQEMEEVIITSSLIDASSDALSNPLHVINGQSIASDASQSIGASLDGLVGISSSDYGAAVGQPIIRGMSGSRVKVLNNGMVVRDVSGLGPDHVNDVDLNNIQQIEIVRGPSSLLYANGTIGGIINVVDNTIAKTDFEEPAFTLGLEAQTVNDGDSHDFSYQNNLGGLNISLAYKDSQFDNYEIPEGAVIHHPGEEEEEEEGYLSNSDTGATAQRLGVSKTGDWGYFGLSFSDTENVYGVPFHGDEHPVDPNAPAEPEDHEDERIFAETDSNIINLEGSYVVGNGWLTKIDYHFRDSDYSHTEQHAEEEGPGNHPEEEPTTFTNDAKEYGAIFDLSNDSLSQKVAINFVDEDVSVIGEEAFINPTQSKELTLGYYVSKEYDSVHIDFGIRHDQISRNGSIADHDHPDEVEYFDREINNTSYALTMSKDINASLDVSLGFASVERAPTAVELLMNGPHLATGRFEEGDPNLKAEISNNIDLSFNYQNDGYFASLTLFKNDVDNYIYLMDEHEDDHVGGDDDDGGDDDGGHKHELIHAEYLQQDAEFNGYELEMGKTFDLARGSLTLSFARDAISGEFADGSNVPRITPERDIYKASYVEDELKVTLSLKDVSAQNDTATEETATDGYQMLNLNLSKTVELSQGNKLILSVFGKNLLDEVARNHSSFVKDEVPLAGRNLGVRASYSF